eukprot:CAMPEP_0206525628 /NCGR_PEP_ID=MMETSP0325_2-20121206/143_1 /ASSEMBLY_ACC=CAM_ASM_000347 /TAXON_ID=2866 /ORGANISM="Crypthecodinium cohnii, Strain Seligo" /LENGTH=130 /DNA_ID=CAMNT_0054020437 /DNA_START=398 /DNA_END=790 /DNA_ORIENTATION=-
MAAIQDHVHLHSSLQRLHDVLVKLIIDNLPCTLEVARNQSVIHAALFVPVGVFDAAAMATVVEEEDVASLGLGCEPSQSGQDVRLRRHNVRAIVPQSADLTVLEAHALLEDAHNSLGIVDATGQTTLTCR